MNTGRGNGTKRTSVVERTLDTGEVGLRCGITGQRVGQLERAALRKLWQRRARQLLREG